MSEQDNDFERKAHASEAAEASRLPSRLHRRLVRSLGAVCVILWVGVLVLFVGDGLEAVPVLTIGLAVSNTALFWQFLRRIHEADRAQAEGIPVRHRRG